MSLTVNQLIPYELGNESQCLAQMERLDDIKLKELLQSHREGALNAGKKLAATFAAAASSGLLRDYRDHEPIYMSDNESNLESTEEDRPYALEDDSSLDEGDTDSEEDGYDDVSEHGDGSATTDDADDSTFIEDASTASNSDDDMTYSMVDDDARILMEDFHGFMKEILERNSTLCLIQFLLNKRAGKENDGPSLVRAMLPWTFSIEDKDEADSLLELDNLSIEY